MTTATTGGGRVLIVPPAGPAGRAHRRAGPASVPALAVHARGRWWPRSASVRAARDGRGFRGQERSGSASGPWSNQSNHAVPSVAYMPITRPVNPVATSVDRYLPSSSASGSGSSPTWKAM